MVSKEDKTSSQLTKLLRAKGFRKKLLATTVAGLLVIGVIMALWWAIQPPVPEAQTVEWTESMDEQGISVGDPQAPVVVREFADYQCPACARFAEAAARLKSNYVENGQVRYIFFDLPLQQPHAETAAQAARCAGDQGDYWGMHEHLFETQEDWSQASEAKPLFIDHVEALGLNTRRFRHCLRTGEKAEAVSNSREVAQEVGAARTPTVWVNDRELDTPGWPQLEATVERLLAEHE